VRHLEEQAVAKRLPKRKAFPRITARDRPAQKAAKAVEWFSSQPRDKDRERQDHDQASRLAERFGINRSYFFDLQKMRAENPAIFGLVLDGVLSVPQAKFLCDKFDNDDLPKNITRAGVRKLIRGANAKKRRK
jgi:hypothetical protein